MIMCKWDFNHYMFYIWKDFFLCLEICYLDCIQRTDMSEISTTTTTTHMWLVWEKSYGPRTSCCWFIDCEVCRFIIGWICLWWLENKEISKYWSSTKCRTRSCIACGFDEWWDWFWWRRETRTWTGTNSLLSTTVVIREWLR